MIDEHAICHEAGHAIVAMSFGLNVTTVCIEDSFPTAVFDTAGATAKEACTVYAAGAAAERIAFGGFGDAASADRREILKTGGGMLEDQLDLASQILKADIECHKAMCKEMTKNWVCEETEASLSGSESDKLNFVILSGKRIKEIWQSYHP